MEISINELRIGNLTLSRSSDEDEFDIKEIECEDFGFVDWLQNKALLISEYYKPIPLTEEWLLKFGFDTYDSEIDYIEWGKTYSGKYQKSFSGNEWIDSDEVDDNGDVFRVTSDGFYSRNELYFSYKLGDFYVRRRIEFVHQLQNIYFALTGEELTLT